MRLSLVAAAAAFLSLSFTAHADLTNDTINATYFFPDQQTVFANLGNITAPGGSQIPGGTGYYTVTGNQITIVSEIEQTFNSSSFNGLVFTDLSKDPKITGITLDPQSTLFDAQATFTSNSVSINLAGLGQISPGDDVIYDLSFAPASSVTPEPSSVALLGTGLLGLAGVARRRLFRA